MDFGSEQTSFHGWIVLRQLGSLLCSHPENCDTPQLTLIAERERSGNSQVSLICHLFDESMMPLHHIHKLRRIGVPMVAAIQQNQRVLFECGRLSRVVNGT